MPAVIDRHGVQELVAQGAQLLDVLAPKEYEEEHIPGAINVPLKALGRETMRQLATGRPVIVYCHDYQ